MRDPGEPEYHEPRRHHRSEKSADAPAAPALDHKKCDQHHSCHRYDIRPEYRGRDLQPLDSASRAPCHTVLQGAAPAVFQPRGGPSNPKRWHHKKSGAEHSIQRHSLSPTGVSGGCAKPIFDHAHERSAKRQGEGGLILCPLSSNLPHRSRRVELRLQQRRKTEEAGSERSVPRDTTKVLKTPEVASA